MHIRQLLYSVALGQVVSLMDTLSCLFVRLLKVEAGVQLPIFQWVLTYIVVCLVAWIWALVQGGKQPSNGMQRLSSRDPLEIGAPLNTRSAAVPEKASKMVKTKVHPRRCTCRDGCPACLYLVQGTELAGLHPDSALDETTLRQHNVDAMDFAIPDVFSLWEPSTVQEDYECVRMHSDASDATTTSSQSEKARSLQSRKKDCCDAAVTPCEVVECAPVDCDSSPNSSEDSRKGGYFQSSEASTAPSSPVEPSARHPVKAECEISPFPSPMSDGASQCAKPMGCISFDDTFGVIGAVQSQHSFAPPPVLSPSGLLAQFPVRSPLEARLCHQSTLGARRLNFPHRSGAAKAFLPNLESSDEENSSDFGIIESQVPQPPIDGSSLCCEGSLTDEGIANARSPPIVAKTNEEGSEIGLPKRFSPRLSVRSDASDDSDSCAPNGHAIGNPSKRKHCFGRDGGGSARNGFIPLEGPLRSSGKSRLMDSLWRWFAVGTPCFFILLAFLDVQGGTLTVVAFSYANLASGSLIDWVSLLTAFLLSVKFMGQRPNKAHIIALIIGFAGSLCILVSDSEGVGDASASTTPFVVDEMGFSSPLAVPLTIPADAMAVAELDLLETGRDETPQFFAKSSEPLGPLPKGSDFRQHATKMDNAPEVRRVGHLRRLRTQEDGGSIAGMLGETVLSAGPKENEASESNLITNFSARQKSLLFGDAMCLIAAVFLGIVTVMMEKALRSGVSATTLLLKTFLPALAIGIVEFAALEYQKVPEIIALSPLAWLYLAASALTMAVAYLLSPIVLARSSSAFYNLSLLTSVGLAVVLSAVILGDPFPPLYSVGLVIILASLVTYQFGS